MLLASRAGQLVTREELKEQVWGNETFVDFEHGLNFCIRQIRAALDDGADTPRFIETVPRRGYRFIAPVQKLDQTGQDFGVSPDILATLPSKAPFPHTHIWLGLISAGLLVVLVFLLSTPGSRHWRFRSLTPGSIRSVAVLPLRNLSGDPAQDYFADGITEALITDLAKIARLHVISHTSVMQFKDTKKALSGVARELNVDAIVEGAVVLSSDRVRITAQLIHAPTDQHIWAETYERDLRDVLRLQDEVARDIAQQVRARLTPQEQTRLVSSRSINPEAYEAYLIGRYYWNKRTEGGVKKAVEYFQQAIVKEPDSALGYAGLAQAYGVTGGHYLPPAEVYPKEKAAASRALQIDDMLAEAHASLAYVLANYEWDWSGAEKEYKRAIELEPGYATAHHWYGLYLLTLGHSKEAIAELKRAQQLDPLSLIIDSSLGLTFIEAHQYDQAINQLKKTLEIDPNFFLAHYQLGHTYLERAMFEQAIAELQKATALSGGSPFMMAGLGHAYAVSGRRGEALRVLGKLKWLSKRTYVPPYHVARIYAGLGEKEQAFEWLEKAYRERSLSVDFPTTDSALEPLRSDPRLQDLLRRIGLQP